MFSSFLLEPDDFAAADRYRKCCLLPFTKMKLMEAIYDLASGSDMLGTSFV
jgi:hypothetical protein